MEVYLAEIFTHDNPDKSFLVCDMDLLPEFPDPLDVIYNVAWDYNGTNTDGIYAVGGLVSVTSLINGYMYGIFPWYPFRDELVTWFCPKERYVIFPNEIHVSHSLRTLLNKNKYRVTFNEAFEEVVKNCSNVNGRFNDKNAWLGTELIEIYNRLHELGIEESVEVWEGDELVGGLFGCYRNGVFQGESMFSIKPSGSKIALVALARRLALEGGKFIDVQIKTPHFESMGARYIDYREYRKLMDGC